MGFFNPWRIVCLVIQCSLVSQNCSLRSWSYSFSFCTRWWGWNFWFWIYDFKVSCTVYLPLITAAAIVRTDCLGGTAIIPKLESWNVFYAKSCSTFLNISCKVTRRNWSICETIIKQSCGLIIILTWPLNKIM